MKEHEEGRGGGVEQAAVGVRLFLTLREHVHARRLRPPLSLPLPAPAYTPARTPTRAHLSAQRLHARTQANDKAVAGDVVEAVARGGGARRRGKAGPRGATRLQTLGGVQLNRWHSPPTPAAAAAAGSYSNPVRASRAIPPSRSPPSRVLAPSDFPRSRPPARQHRRGQRHGVIEVADEGGRHH